MSSHLSQTLSQPSREKETKYNLIVTMSQDINRGYSSLKTLISGGGNKASLPTKKKGNILAGKQVTSFGQERESKWKDQRGFEEIV